jgi:4a-hydroxytetrahydrobiopterin dehydratase
MAKPSRDKLKNPAISRWLKEVPGWKATDGRSAIARTYVLPSFRASLAFVQLVGEVAEAHDHHPDIDVRYRKVTLTLSTHSAGGLTEKDFALAIDVDGGDPSKVKWAS